MENNLLDKVSKMFRYLEVNYKFKTKIGLEGSISDLIKEYPDTSRFCYISYLDISNFDQNRFVILHIYFGKIVEEIVFKMINKYRFNSESIGQNEIKIL